MPGWCLSSREEWKPIIRGSIFTAWEHFVFDVTHETHHKWRSYLQRSFLCYESERDVFSSLRFDLFKVSQREPVQTKLWLTWHSLSRLSPKVTTSSSKVLDFLSDCFIEEGKLSSEKIRGHDNNEFNLSFEDTRGSHCGDVSCIWVCGYLWSKCKVKSGKNLLFWKDLTLQHPLLPPPLTACHSLSLRHHNDW